MDNRKRKLIATVIVVLTVLTAATLASTLTSLAANGYRNTISGENESLEDFYARYQRLDEIYTLLRDKYYKELDTDTLLQGAINGMIETLDDPYTIYYTPDQMQTEEAVRSGSYVGLGVEVSATSEGYITITRVFKNSPAEEAGLMKGDAILSADGRTLKAKTSAELSEAVSHIKGEEGTYVTLEVSRGDEKLTISVQRRSVVDAHVERYMLDNHVGYLRLYSFFGDAVSAVDEALEFFRKNDVQAIVLDLRDNGGGLLDVCINIGDRFLPEGVFLYIENRQGERTYFYTGNEYMALPLAVLINENSASASEVLAGAIQDTNTGVLIGKTSYGKGVVQTEYQYPFFEDGAAFKLTTSVYYTPNGRSLNLLGLTPDIAVENEITINEPGVDLLPENDAQLRAAYEYLLDKIEIEHNADD